MYHTRLEGGFIILWGQKWRKSDFSMVISAYGVFSDFHVHGPISELEYEKRG